MLEHGLQLVNLITDNDNDVDRDVEVMNKIKALIEKHQLEVGDKLPSERKLSEKLSVSRNQIRAAIQKLEFYGIIKTMPQSGSVITGIGMPSINSMMTDILDLELPDFRSLVETRVIIETQAIKLAAVRRSEESLKELEEAQLDFQEKILNGEPSVIEDLKFHLAIVKCSENTVIYGLMKIIVPGIIGHFNKEHICDRSEAVKLNKEHNAILKGIKDKNPEEALKAMEIHFTALREYIKK
ncbi:MULTISPECIES: FadR/GntR family transcriptional regulator [Nonlabens]|uniref:GntR family transcriptional repressor for pyruvate dehydrogenase complex n=1 Tax=Nonlabens xylanidelens TaxID=191564 RepID=A0A2S6IJN3_9FLAO|nr:FCD domain-containing protein [Nonlabens xylanidelens]PPK94437.1 GntR family transcriptional repressor for pyruvate dehydrogenase complex [Nonlabens xylanidelens]PQJ21404.1 GntR family transcriptional regulator [Nonlabens xylanidelens]